LPHHASPFVGQVLNLHGRQLRRIAPEAFDAIHGALADCYYKQYWIYLDCFDFILFLYWLYIILYCY
jgi:hypothetical protein